MDYLLAYVVTGLFVTGGYLVYGLLRAWSTARKRRHELRIARMQVEAELRQAELETRVREMELANEIYQDFKRRHPSP
jgi:hypothetical protein